MNNTVNYKSWIGTICKTGDKCPVEGNWEQRGTGFKCWHEVGDIFAPLEEHPYQRVYYEYLGK